MLRGGLTMGACGLLLLAQGCCALQAQTFPPPGKLIDIGGRRVHLYCTGAGSPTVILTAGGGAFSIDWDLVQPGAARTTRVCSWDRAGLGWSDSGPEDETVEQTVTDLHAVLVAAREKAPFVLVGASIGGIFIQAYHRTYPKDVAALVFTNSSNHVGLLVNGKPELLWLLTGDQIRSAFPLPASAKGNMPVREGEPFDRLPAALQATRLWFDQQFWKNWRPERERPDEMLSWRKEFLKEFALTDASQDPPLGTVPVAVIASDPAASPSQRNSHEGAAARLDFLSSNTMHVTATGSGHEIHLYQPEAVIQTIARVVSAIRSGSRLSH
ncbi:MAG TPA: alpha/beta hydrolase [Bryobacteraceae bacterium]|nr:alpha/beta hydrolase [Bryobacteraceae bacterium]